MRSAPVCAPVLAGAGLPASRRRTRVPQLPGHPVPAARPSPAAHSAHSCCDRRAALLHAVVCRSAPPGPCLTPPLGGARRRGGRRRRGCAVGRGGARRPGARAARTRAARPGSGLCGRSAAGGGGGGSGGRGRAAGAGRRRVVAGGAAAGGGAGAARRGGRAGTGGRVRDARRADAGRGARAGGRGARGRRALIQAATRLQRQLDAVQGPGRPVGVLGVLLRCWAQAGRPRPGSCGAAPQGVRARARRSGPGLPARSAAGRAGPACDDRKKVLGQMR